MSQKEIVKRMEVENRETIVLWLAIAGFCVGLSLYAGSKFWIFSFSILFLYCALALSRSFYDKIKITDDEIVVTRYFRTREIHWSDISRLESKLTGFLLINNSEDNRIFISAEIINLWEFLKILKKYRRDLLQPTKNVFHENPIVAVVLVIAGSFIMYYGIKGLNVSRDSIQIGVIILIGLGFVLVAMLFWKKFSFVDGKLKVKTLIKEQCFELEGLDFSSSSSRSILIISKKGYAVSVQNLIEGMPVFLITFQTWLQTRSGKFHETVE